MTMTNHFLVGAVIALTVEQPVVAVPLAFLSHFILDSLPHYGEGKNGIEYRPSRASLTMYVIDILAWSALMVYLLVNGQFYAMVLGLVAFSPDVVWIYRAVKKYFTGISKPRNALSRFHESMQREYLWGWFPEIILAVVLIILITSSIT